MIREQDYPVIAEFDKIVAGRYDRSRTDFYQLASSWHVPERDHALECVDGFFVSMQASAFHYCRPRDNYGPYSHVELGFPSNMRKHDREVLFQYQERMEGYSMEKSVYPWTPIKVVRDLIIWHCIGRSSPGKHIILGVLLVLLTLLIYALGGA